GTEHGPFQSAMRAEVFLGSMVLFPTFFAAAAGASLGKGDAWSRKVSALPAFSAVRPVTSAEMVAAKLRVALRSVLLTWALAFLVILGFLPFSPGGAVLGQWVRQLLETRGVKGGVLLGLVVLALPALS